MTTLRLPGGNPVLRAVRTFLAEGRRPGGFLPADGPLIVACSGGADSLALAASVRAAVPPEGPRGRDTVSAAVIDHGLQRGSAEVADRAEAALRRIGYSQVQVRRVVVDGPGGMEAAARAARYAALGAIAAEAGPGAAVLLGHTADDQAETVLLGLSRGSGPRSVAGMRPWDRPWGRPLLAVSRAETEGLCRALGLDPWQDPQNADGAFTRVRLRTEVLPLLEQVLGGGVAGALGRTAELMADDLAALDSLAEQVLTRIAVPAAAGVSGAGARAASIADPGEIQRGVPSGTGAVDLDCPPLAEYPAAIRRRVLRRWLLASGVTAPTYVHLTALDRVVTDGHSGQSVRLPGARDATRRGRLLALGERLG